MGSVHSVCVEGPKTAPWGAQCGAYKYNNFRIRQQQGSAIVQISRKIYADSCLV